MIAIEIALNLLIIWFTLTWAVRIIARIFMPTIKFEDDSFIFAWPHAPQWYFKRLSKKSAEKITLTASFWVNLVVRSTRLLNVARVPMLLVFIADLALTVFGGPGLQNSVDILVDVVWIGIILDDLRRDDNWRKRAKKLKEKVVTTEAGLKVVPVKG